MKRLICLLFGHSPITEKAPFAEMIKVAREGGIDVTSHVPEFQIICSRCRKLL